MNNAASLHQPWLSHRRRDSNPLLASKLLARIRNYDDLSISSVPLGDMT